MASLSYDDKILIRSLRLEKAGMLQDCYVNFLKETGRKAQSVGMS